MVFAAGSPVVFMVVWMLRGVHQRSLTSLKSTCSKVKTQLQGTAGKKSEILLTLPLGSGIKIVVNLFQSLRGSTPSLWLFTGWGWRKAKTQKLCGKILTFTDKDK